MSVYLSRLICNPASNEVRRDLSDCQAMHRRIMTAFPSGLGTEARKQMGVLHVVDVMENPVRVILTVQSGVLPDWSSLPDGYCLDGGIQSKEISKMLQCFQSGVCFRFRLVANPVKKTGGSLKEDRLMGKKVNAKRVPLRTEEQMEWLCRQGERNGFILYGDTEVNGKLTVTGRKSHEGVQMRHDGVSFLGRLRITDISKFTRCMLEGVGAGKAYGLGMMQLLGRID